MKKAACMITVTVLLLSATACSNRAMYFNGQTNLRTECHEGPMSQYDECMARTSRSYEEYQRDREEALQQGRQSRQSQ